MNGHALAAPSLSFTPARRIAWESLHVFDWLFIVLGGLPVILPLVFLLSESGLSRQSPIYWYFWMNAVLSAPHVYSTYCRLTRKIRERRVSWLVGIPAYAACFAVLALASRLGFYLQALTAVNVWQSLHYVRQTYGVSRVYSRGMVEEPLTRTLSFYAYHLAMPLFLLGRWDVLYTVWGGKASSAIIPVDVSDWLMASCWVLAACGLGLGIASEWRRYRANGHAYSPIGAVNLATYFAIFIFGFLSVTYYQRGFFAVTIYHAVQYLGLVWILERKHASGGLGGVIQAAPQWAGFLVFWGVLFAAGFFFENRLLSVANQVWLQFSAIALAAVSAHHYTVDTFIWRAKAGS